MLQLTNGSIVETLAANANTNSANLQRSVLQNQQASLGNLCSGLGSSESYTIGGAYNCYPLQTHWYSYPVYACTDKTAKAIEILKALQADKIMEVKSVNKFIELVEKISGIL